MMPDRKLASNRRDSIPKGAGSARRSHLFDRQPGAPETDAPAAQRAMTIVPPQSDTHATRSGGGLQAGRRQSMPSQSMGRCAGVSRAVAGNGHGKRPRPHVTAVRSARSRRGIGSIPSPGRARSRGARLRLLDAGGPAAAQPPVPGAPADRRWPRRPRFRATTSTGPAMRAAMLRSLRPHQSRSGRRNRATWPRSSRLRSGWEVRKFAT